MKKRKIFINIGLIILDVLMGLNLQWGRAGLDNRELMVKLFEKTRWL